MPRERGRDRTRARSLRTQTRHGGLTCPFVRPESRCLNTGKETSATGGLFPRHLRRIAASPSVILLHNMAQARRPTDAHSCSSDKCGSTAPQTKCSSHRNSNARRTISRGATPSDRPGGSPSKSRASSRLPRYPQATSLGTSRGVQHPAVCSQRMATMRSKTSMGFERSIHSIRQWHARRWPAPVVWWGHRTQRVRTQRIHTAWPGLAWPKLPAGRLRPPQRAGPWPGFRRHSVICVTYATSPLRMSCPRRARTPLTPRATR